MIFVQVGLSKATGSQGLCMGFWAWHICCTLSSRHRTPSILWQTGTFVPQPSHEGSDKDTEEAVQDGVRDSSRWYSSEAGWVRGEGLAFRGFLHPQHQCASEDR